MTAKEMIRRFGTQIHQGNLRNPFDTDDILYFLNRAQLKLVKDHFDQSPYSPFTYQDRQSIFDDIRTMFVKDEKIETTYGGEASQFKDKHVDTIEFPEDYMFFVSARAEVEYLWKGIEWVVVNGKREVTNLNTNRLIANVKVARPNEIYKSLSDPFNNGIYSRPIADINDTNLNVFSDNTYVTDYVILDYIRKPSKIEYDGTIDNGSMLPDSTHEEIIELAVQIASQSSNSQE